MKKRSGAKISIIGAGNVGTALAYHLAKSGVPFAGIFSRRRLSAVRAIRAAGKGQVFSSLRELIAMSDIIIIAVNDSEIGNVVQRIARGNSSLKARQGRHGPARKVFIHTCGSLPSSVLLPLLGSGAAIASMHPLQTISSYDGSVKPLKGIFFCIEGESAAVSAARRIACKVGAKALIINAKDKSAYHLAAAFLSNYIVALTDMALDIIPSRSLTKRELSKIFSPLIAGTARNLGTRGIADALTGPISRGDVGTLRKHLEILKKESPELRTLHGILARRALKIAVGNNRLSALKKALLIRLLGRGS